MLRIGLFQAGPEILRHHVEVPRIVERLGEVRQLPAKPPDRLWLPQPRESPQGGAGAPRGNPDLVHSLNALRVRRLAPDVQHVLAPAQHIAEMGQHDVLRSHPRGP